MKTDTLKKMLLMLLCVVSVNMTALGKEQVSDVLPILISCFTMIPIMPMEHPVRTVSRCTVLKT